MGFGVGGIRLAEEPSNFLLNLIEELDRQKIRLRGGKPLTWSDWFRKPYYNKFYKKTRQERVDAITELILEEFEVYEERGDIATKERIKEIVSKACNGGN